MANEDKAQICTDCLDCGCRTVMLLGSYKAARRERGGAICRECHTARRVEGVKNRYRNHLPYGREK